jgi:hypothetical protein
MLLKSLVANGRDGGIEMPAVQVDSDDRGYRPVDSEVRYAAAATARGCASLIGRFTSAAAAASAMSAYHIQL